MGMLSYQEVESTIEKLTALTPPFIRAQEYLKERGLDTSILSRAGITIHPAKEIFDRIYRNKSYDDRVAIVFQHYDLRKNPLRWWSCRLVERDPSRPSPVVRGKMFCPPNEPPHGYLAPLTDFAELKHGDTIYIHESCIKSLNGSALGYHSVGLNGVYGFTSRKHRVDLIEELRDLPWKPLALKAKIVFDSNAADNPNIQQAISMLAERLNRLCGVEATHLLLPKSPEDEHWGFDDAVVEFGHEWAIEFLNQEGSPVQIGEIEYLKTKLNNEVVVVRSLGRIADQERGYLMNKNVFTDVVYARYTARVPDGETIKIVNVPKLWLSDAKRVEVERIEYMPGAPRIHNNTLNLWHEMGCQPIPGEIQPFFDVVVNNVGDHDIVRWMFQWMAYPLQNLGAKLNSYMHLFGPSGIGKNMVLRPLERIYGENFVRISRDNLESNFNSIYSAKQLVHIDELYGGDRTIATKISQKLKFMVTNEKIPVNMKGQPEYEISNFANFISTSNYYDSLRLDDDDRRACVIKFENIDDKRGDQEYWMEYVNWCDNGGAEALYHYLLEYDTDDFDVKGWAPATQWKDQVKDASRSPLERWVHDLGVEPETILPMSNLHKSLFTTKELAVLYYGIGADDLKKGQIDAVSIHMRNAGFEMANGGKLVKVKGMPARYWIVRGRHLSWDHNDCVRHLDLK